MTERSRGAAASDSIPHRRVALHILLIVLVSGLVYWPRLGADGFTDSEGHRVVPAWEMRETGEWLVPRMFGQVYVRKPPGIQWAIAGSAAVLGESEFSARAVSALATTLGVLLSYVFAARWFGTRWALAAGLAHALMPWFWSSGRSAEIEALHNLCVQSGVLLVIDLWLRPRALLRLLALSGSLVGASVVKGPAGATFLVGAMLAPCVVARTLRPLAQWRLWLALGAATAATAGLFLAMAAAVRQSGETPVAQGFTEFLWSRGSLTHEQVLRVVGLLPTTFLAALPVSLAVLFPFGRDAIVEDPSPEGWQRRAIAAALAWTFALGVLFLAILGVGNVRYAMPGAACITPVVAYLIRGCAGAFTGTRHRFARVFVLGSRWAWPALLLIGAAAWILAVEPRRDSRSGRAAGGSLGAELVRDAKATHRDQPVLYADHLIEARPEVLLYARNRCEANGLRVVMRWVPGLATDEAGRPLDPDGYVVLRLDGDEYERFSAGHHLDSALGDWRTHIYHFGLFRTGSGP